MVEEIFIPHSWSQLKSPDLGEFDGIYVNAANPADALRFVKGLIERNQIGPGKQWGIVEKDGQRKLQRQLIMSDSVTPDELTILLAVSRVARHNMETLKSLKGMPLAAEIERLVRLDNPELIDVDIQQYVVQLAKIGSGNE